jgi:hypothetical protein
MSYKTDFSGAFGHPVTLRCSGISHKKGSIEYTAAKTSIAIY